MLSGMLPLGDIFKGKKITQMGLGLLGRGIGDADFLARHGADLIVTDIKNKEDLAESVTALSGYSNITFHLGGHTREDFIDRDLILKGAGVPLKNDFITTARSAGVPVDMSASLFARITKIPMIGVTGTRGKSTVTHLLHAILKEDGRSVVLGGNVKGVSNLSLFDGVTDDSIGVFELDSWQCQGFAEEKSLDHPRVTQRPLSPSVAVFTTFMPDHLAYYDGDINAYLKDKANIFLFQNSSDVLVIGKQALPALAPYKREIKSHVIVADETEVPKGWKSKLIGAHNRYNIGVAVATARAFGVDDEIIRAAVENMSQLPGRLEHIRTIGGVEVYNDTNATTPEAAAKALEALDEGSKKTVVLIAGGFDKGIDAQALAEAVENHAKTVVLIPGTGTEKLRAALVGVNVTVKDAPTLKEAFDVAVDVACEGDSVALSPAYASFGMFKNEYDRGEQFNEIVKNYGA